MKKISRGVFVSLFFKTAIYSIISIFFLSLSSSIYANYSSITGVTINPPNPALGQPFNLSIQMCLDEYNTPNELVVAASTSSAFQNPGINGQVFLLSSLGVDVHSSNPNNASNGYVDFGCHLTQPTPFVTNCTDCAGSYAMSVTESYNLTMPSAAELGSQCGGASTIYLQIGSYSFYFYNTTWTSLYNGACGAYETSWALPAPPANSITLSQRAEGELQSVGDLVLYSIDYSYGNGPLTITDSLPGSGNLSLATYGPLSITGGTITAPALGSTSGTITWNFPNSTTTKQGTVWLLMKMTTAISAGTQVQNTASAASGSNNMNSSAIVTAGQPAVSVQKFESASALTAMAGNSATITYYLNYEVNGDQMKAFRAFDDTALGAYTSLPPSGWKFIPSGADNGTWTISDFCGTGDRVLWGAAQTNSYPALLLDDPAPSNVQICTGLVEADVLINPGSDPGADGLVILRSNGLTGNLNYSYSLLLSLDTAPANGYISIQKCSAGTCSWYAPETTFPITGNTWYRTKTNMTVSGNDYVFQYKIWQVGQPEPSGYLGIWTDSGAAANASFNCSGTGTYLDWRPGVGEQSGVYGNENDEYNNFIAYAPRTAANAALFDTVPAGLTYISSSPIGTNSAGFLTWNLGNISYQSGTYTWWASTNACGQSFTNVAGIGGTGMAPQFSNPVVSGLNCISPTITLTTPPSSTPSVTYTISPTTTNILTKTATMTYTPVNTAVNTATITVTFTTTPTAASPTFTNIPTKTVTMTAINTAVVTATVTSTQIPPGSTMTSTPTVSPTIAINLSASLTVSPASAAAGQGITVIMQVVNTGTNTANNVQPSSLIQTGGGVAAFLSGPSPASATIAGGFSASFTWVYNVTICGNITFSCTASGTDAVDGVSTTSMSASSNTFTCATATATYTQVPPGSTLTATRTVTPIDSLTSIVTASFTPTIPLCLVDTLSNCNSTNVWGGQWYTYNDSSYGGTSVVWPGAGSTFIMSSPGFDGGSDCAAQMTGVVTTAYPGGFIGMDSQLNANAGSPTYQETNISGATGVMFWCKGDGKNYTIKIPYTSNTGSSLTGNDDYSYSFYVFASSWTQIGIPFSGGYFKQAGTGTAVPFATVLQHAKDIQFQTSGQPQSSVDLWIDDLQLYGGCSMPTSTSTPTPTRTTILTRTVSPTPTVTYTYIPIFSPTPTITPTFTCTATPASLCSVDTMASCSNVNVWGGAWFTYNDANDGGTSVVWPAQGQTFIMSSPGYSGGADCAAQMTGVVTIAYQYGFIGMGTLLNPNAGAPNYQSTDLSGALGVSFYTRGDGNVYTIIITYLNSSGNTMTNWDDYAYTFVAFSGWSQYTIPFTAFTQPYYTPSQYQVPLVTVLQNAKQFQFATTTQPLAGVDLWIDNLSVYGCIIPAFTPTITTTLTSVPSGSTMTNTPTITLTSTITPTYTMTPTVNPNTVCYSLQWGTPGTGIGQFDYPYGVAVDASGYVYVADLYNNRVEKFTPAGAYVTQWGSSGSGNGQFSYPVSIAIDAGGYVYVTDWNNSRVEKFTSTGTYVTQWGSYGTGAGQFEYPYGIAVDSSGYLYVTDAENSRVEKFTSTGAYVTQWGTNGSGNSQFNYPAGIAVDSSGYVYVADSYNYRIQKFTSTGTYVTQWGSNGSGNSQFDYPFGITIGGNGFVYVADTYNNRVQAFTSTGTYITQWGSYGTGNGQFNGPVGIVTDSTGAIYVSDYNNNRVQKFIACVQLTATPTNTGLIASATYTPTYTVTATSTRTSTQVPSGSTMTSTPTMTPTIGINLVAGLIVSPNVVAIGQDVTVLMEVVNVGTDTANSVKASPLFQTGGGAAVLVSSPNPSSTNIGPGSYTIFTWVYSMAICGDIVFNGTASGTDAADGVSMTSPQCSSNTLSCSSGAPTATSTMYVAPGSTYTITPTLTPTFTMIPSGSTLTVTPVVTPTIGINLVAGLTVSPASAGVDQDITVIMQVVNIGTNTADNVVPSSLMQAGGGAAVPVNPVSPSSASIGSYAQASFTWVYKVVICNNLTFSGTVSGTDAVDSVSMTSSQCESNMMTCATATPTTSNTMTATPTITLTNTPTITPTIAINLIASMSLSPSSAAGGQQITVVMQVANTGMNTANNVLPVGPVTVWRRRGPAERECAFGNKHSRQYIGIVYMGI